MEEQESGYLESEKRVRDKLVALIDKFAGEGDGAEMAQAEPHVRDGIRDGQSDSLIRRIADVFARAVLGVGKEADVERILGVLQECVVVDRMEEMEKFGGADSVYRRILEQVVVSLAEMARGRGKSAGVEDGDGGSGDEAVSGVGNVRRAARGILMEED